MMNQNPKHDSEDVTVFVTRDSASGEIEALAPAAGGIAVEGMRRNNEHPCAAADRIVQSVRPPEAVDADLFAFRRLALERDGVRVRHIFQVSPESPWPDQFVGMDGASYVWVPFTWSLNSATSASNKA